MKETAPLASSQAAASPLTAIIRDEIARGGPMTFARYMELALYHPDYGYYLAVPRRPGRQGDFLTAPEVHPFFGLTIGRQLVECWDRLGRPAPFTVVEFGSGIGGLAYDVIVGMLDTEPAIRSGLRYRLNEVNPHRTQQALAAMREAGFGEIVAADVDAAVTGVVLANEVADALPAHRLQWTGTGFEELFVGWDDARGFVDAPGPLSRELARWEPRSRLIRYGVDVDALPVGARLEVSPAAAAWMREVASRLARGYALVVDYGYPASELYRDHRLRGLVRAYEGHTVTDDPYGAPGEQDLTAHVDFSALIASGQEAGLDLVGLATQADFLANAGMGEFLVGLQHEPDTSIEEYYRAQAAVFRLIDPGGMGRFRVLGMAKGVPAAPPLRGFAASSLPTSLRW
jgi:SAM-dependent MidA family methyltransferase